MIERARSDADERLTVLGLRVRDVFVTQNVRTSMLMEANSFQGRESNSERVG